MKYCRLICALPRSSLTGRQRSAASFVKRGGMIPTRVVVTPFSTNVRPRMPGSRLNFFNHILSAITNTGGAVGLASAGVMPRPRTGGTPRNVNMFAVTMPPS